MVTIRDPSKEKVVPLGSIVSINPESIGKGYPYTEIEYIDISSVGSGNLSEIKMYNIVDAPSRAKRLVSHGDLILSTVRPNRRSFLFIKHPSPHMVVSTGFAVLRPSRDIDPRFLYYIVTDQLFTDYLTANAKGAAYPAVDTDTIARAEVFLPPLPAQRKIAAILSAYDDLIENNTRRIKILEEMAQALYREWFVHFRFPGHKKVKMVDSPLGKIPEGWEVRPFTDLVIVLSGGTPKTTVKEYWRGDIPFFAPKDAPTSFYITETGKSISSLGLSKCNSQLYSKNTVFITARGTVGKVVMPAVNMAMNQSCYALDSVVTR